MKKFERKGLNLQSVFTLILGVALVAVSVLSYNHIQKLNEEVKAKSDLEINLAILEGINHSLHVQNMNLEVELEEAINTPQVITKVNTKTVVRDLTLDELMIIADYMKPTDLGNDNGWTDSEWDFISEVILPVLK